MAEPENPKPPLRLIKAYDFWPVPQENVGWLLRALADCERARFEEAKRSGARVVMYVEAKHDRTPR